MEKVIIRSIVFIVAVLVTWFLFFQINWMDVFKVNENTSKLEEKLGKLYWESIKRQEDIILDKDVVEGVDSLFNHICEANNIDRDEIKLHLVSTSEVNAFTLPDKHIILNSGLILSAESEGELAGVICHELAHMTENHVMKKLMKEVGLSVLVSMSSGGGGDVIRETASVLSSSAFDRDMEEEADQKAVDYMIKAGLDPEGFADFMYKLSQEENELLETFSWLSTHPLSEDRAIDIVEYMNEQDYETEDFMSEEDWEQLQERVKEVALDK